MKKFLLLLVLLSQVVFSQEERKTIFGIIYGPNGILENAHIVNTNTHQATFSNKKGEYQISAKPNDSIKFTSIGYKTVFELLTKQDFNTYIKLATLKKQNYKLDEVLIKNNELSGELAKDLKKVKINLKQESIINATDFTEIDLKKKSTNDYVDTKVKSNIVSVDPTTNFEGVGTTIFITLKESKKLDKSPKK